MKNNKYKNKVLVLSFFAATLLGASVVSSSHIVKAQHVLAQNNVSNQQSTNSGNNNADAQSAQSSQNEDDSQNTQNNDNTNNQKKDQIVDNKQVSETNNQQKALKEANDVKTLQTTQNSNHNSFSDTSSNETDSNSSESNSNDSSDNNDDEKQKSDEESQSTSEESKTPTQNTSKIESTFKPIDSTRYGSFSIFQILIYGVVIAAFIAIAFLIYKSISRGNWSKLFENVKHKLSKDVVENPYEEHFEQEIENDEKENPTPNEIETNQLINEEVAVENVETNQLVNEEVAEKQPESVTTEKIKEVTYSRQTKEVIVNEVEKTNVDSLLEVANKSTNVSKEQKVNDIYNDLLTSSKNKENVTKKASDNLSNLDTLFDGLNLKNDFDK